MYRYRDPYLTCSVGVFLMQVYIIHGRGLGTSLPSHGTYVHTITVGMHLPSHVLQTYCAQMDSDFLVSSMGPLTDTLKLMYLSDHSLNFFDLLFLHRCCPRRGESECSKSTCVLHLTESIKNTNTKN